MGSTASATPDAEQVENLVETRLDSEGKTTFIVYFADRADTAAADDISDWGARGEAVVSALRATAAASQAGVREGLDAAGVDYTTFWASNAILVKAGDAALVDDVAADREVSAIRANHVQELAPTTPGSGETAIDAVEWGIANINADDVWSTFGARGEGIVVAGIDTGADFDHPALVGKYRGNLGGGGFDHNYNWFDPSHVCGNPSLVPCDNNDHGSHTMGTMVGDDGAGNQIGVAPGAEWIEAKGCETSSCSDAALLASGQWILAPTDLNGSNPRPDLRPNIVNNSWGGGGGDPWYDATVDAWVDAGIFPAFSNGNSGPSCDTAGSPGDGPEAYASGAYDINNVIADFSSRGPGRGSDIRPNLAAPGVHVRSSVDGGGYASFNGTSMASPHTAGTVALIWSAAPSLIGDVDATRQLLDEPATDVDSLGCGGTVDDNNNFGEGRLNAFAAVEMALTNPPPDVRSDAPMVTVDEGQSASNTGTYSSEEPTDVDISASAGTVMKTGTDSGTWSWSYTPDDGPSDGQVVTITADNGTEATTDFTLEVDNVEPKATFNAPGSVLTGDPIELSLTSPSDPSTADTSAGFDYAFDCGGGYGPFGSDNSVSCPTGSPGNVTVKGKLRDKDGGVSEYTGTVTVGSLRSGKQAVRDDLAAFSTGNPSADAKVAKAVAKLDASLAPALWGPDGIRLDPKNGQKVFDREREAIDELKKINPPPFAVSGAIGSLREIDRKLAKRAIDDVVIPATGKPGGIKAAQKELEKANEDYAKGNAAADPGQAVDRFKQAWEHAQAAITHASRA